MFFLQVCVLNVLALSLMPCGADCEAVGRMHIDYINLLLIVISLLTLLVIIIIKLYTVVVFNAKD